MGTNSISTRTVTTKPCSVCIQCAVCPGGKCLQYFCSGLSMVIAVNVGYVWELPRLACLRWHILGICQGEGCGGSPAAARSQLRITHTPATARTGLGGGVAGAEPPHKGGPNRPDRPNCSGQWSGVREFASPDAVLTVKWLWLSRYPELYIGEKVFGVPGTGWGGSSQVKRDWRVRPEHGPSVPGGRRIYECSCRARASGSSARGCLAVLEPA